MKNREPGSPAPGRYLVYDISEDTLISGQEYQILRAREFDASLRQVAQRECAFSAESGLIVDLGGDTHQLCRLQIPLSRSKSGYFQITSADTIEVKREKYAVDSTLAYSEEQIGSGGFRSGTRRSHAIDIGVYYYHTWYYPNVNTSEPTRDWEAELTYAKVGGQVYGTSLLSEVSVDPMPGTSQGELRIARIYPIPFRDEVQFTLEGNRTGAVIVEMFDLLGRLMATSEIPPGQADVNLWLGSGPSGVYVVRVTDRSGRYAVRSVVRVAAGAG